MARWENAERWYEARIQRDLFGQWMVYCYWGGKYTKKNGRTTYLVNSEADGLSMIESLNHLRMKSKPPYQRIS